MAYEIGTFPCKDGFMRWARREAPDKARGCVLMLIGWGEWLEKYSAFSEQWYKRGFEVVILERRGQGLSSRFLENRGKAWLPDYLELIEDFDTFYNHYFAGEETPLLLCGHSMGAHLLLRWYAEKTPPEPIKGLVLFSPMQHFSTAPFSFGVAQWITGFACMLGFGKTYAPGQENYDPANIPFQGNAITHDESSYQAMVLALRDNPLLKTGGITFGWLQATFRSIRALRRRLRLGAPPGPYLVLSPAKDPLVGTEAIKEIAAYLPHCESQYFDEAAHELLQEKPDIRKQVWAAVDDFIKGKFDKGEKA
jgi:lysophospholipase